MLQEIFELYNLDVYTHKGIYLGRIHEVMVDLEKYQIYEIILGDTNQTIIDDGRSIGVPYRWIQSVSEVVVLRYFPGKVHVSYKPSRLRKKRRKLRVLKHSRFGHGVSRTPWRAPKESSYES